MAGIQLGGLVSGLDTQSLISQLMAAERMPRAELTALIAWRDGGAPEGSIPVDAAPAIATMLEALAHLEDFDGFERLAGAVEALALPWRERRELLATVYYRRGFLDSAANDWIAAVEREGADERALLGMAGIADARGLAEDAAVFRAEAQALSTSGTAA